MNKISPAVIGLGYVGLPIFLRLRSKFKSLGFDTNLTRVSQLNKGIDINNEFNSINLKQIKNSKISYNIKDLKKCNFFIITVPTPIEKNKKPISNLYILHALKF
jgi:UDP-N-acetyl-D-galactosamine dehydrogenase